jgi:hypothetical protein
VVVNRNADILVRGDIHVVDLAGEYWSLQLLAGNISKLNDVVEEPVQADVSDHDSDAEVTVPIGKAVKRRKVRSGKS